MNKEAALNIVTETLKDMGCTDISFQDTSADLIIVIFNCKEITSFVTDIPNWKNLGIQLDKSGNRQYKINFIKE